MRSRFSLLQLGEVTAIVGATLAADRLPPLWRGGGLWPVLLLIVLCGTLTGVYLGIRWNWRKDAWSIISSAGIAAAIATLLNAIRIGVMVAEDLRRSTDGAYFDWSKDWPQLFGWILGVTMVSTILAPVCSMIPAFVLQRLRHNAR